MEMTPVPETIRAALRGELPPMPPEMIHAIRGALRVSKHRQFDRDGKWIEGNVRIMANSSLRKLMRAARRGKVPLERVRDIGLAQESSQRRMAHRWQRCEASMAAAVEAAALNAKRRAAK